MGDQARARARARGKDSVTGIAETSMRKIMTPPPPTWIQMQYQPSLDTSLTGSIVIVFLIKGSAYYATKAITFDSVQIQCQRKCVCCRI